MIGKLEIRKMVLEALIEADMTSHSSERAVDRVFAEGRVRVGYWLGIPGKHREMGWYTIPQQVLSEIRRRIDVISKKNFPKACDYSIVLHKFHINQSEVDFDSSAAKSEFLASKRPIVITDPVTNSNGTLLAAIVKGNAMVTIMFMFDPSMSQTQARKGIFIKTFDNVEMGRLRCP